MITTEDTALVIIDVQYENFLYNWLNLTPIPFWLLQTISPVTRSGF